MDLLLKSIDEFLALYLTVFFRILAMFSQMPGLSSKSITTKVKVLMGLSITLVMAPMLPKVIVKELMSIDFFIIILQHIIIGVGMGFVLKIFVDMFSFCGFMLSMQAGLSFAATVDPSNGQQVPIMSQFYTMVTTLLFFLFDYHLICFEILFHSFETLPPHIKTFSDINYTSLWKWSASIFEAGFIMATTAVFSLFLINLSFGVMTKAAPQLNIFSLGFPVTMLCGLFIMYLVFDYTNEHVIYFWKSTKLALCNYANINCVQRGI